MILCNVNWHLNNFRLFNDDTNYAQGWKEVPNPNHQQDKNFQRIWKLPVDPVSLDDLSTWWRTFAAEKCEESVTLETKQLAFKFDDSWRIWIENGGLENAMKQPVQMGNGPEWLWIVRSLNSNTNFCYLKALSTFRHNIIRNVFASFSTESISSKYLPRVE